MKRLTLKSFRLKNFKAVKDSGVVRFTPLTVLIGNNGSGKSSLIEGLDTFQSIIEEDLAFAMEFWRGYESVWHRGVSHGLHGLQPEKDLRACYSNPMSFELRGEYLKREYKARMQVALGLEDDVFIADEEIRIGKDFELLRDSRGQVRFKGAVPSPMGAIKVQSAFSPQALTIADGDSVIGNNFHDLFKDWQFVSLNAHAQFIGQPNKQQRSLDSVYLSEDGENIAEYLLSIKKLSQEAFDGIVEAVQHVLPYARELQPTLVTELERSVYLQMAEGKFKVPGWMLSTGTLRLLAFLALLRHPHPPSLIIIEEIENGLDPRTINLLIEEIRVAVENGGTQVICTTHSPYLLDLLKLSEIILVERIDGEPTFMRPGDRKSLEKWSEKFSVGRLYTMGLLERKGA